MDQEDGKSRGPGLREWKLELGGKSRGEGRKWSRFTKYCSAPLFPLICEAELVSTADQRLWPEPWQATQVLAWPHTWPFPPWRGSLPQINLYKNYKHPKSYSFLKQIYKNKNKNQCPPKASVFSLILIHMHIAINTFILWASFRSLSWNAWVIDYSVLKPNVLHLSSTFTNFSLFFFPFSPSNSLKQQYFKTLKWFIYSNQYLLFNQL